MATPIPADGGILIGAETTYGTEASSKSVMIGTSSSMGLRRQTAKSRTRPNRRGPKLAQLASHVDGEVVFAYSYTDSVVADVLGALGAITGTTTKTCSIGLGSSPDADSLTIGVNHGGLEYTYTGCVPTRFSLEFDAESDAQATLGVSGQAVAKEATPTTLTLPAASTMLMASDYGTLTLNSDTFDFRTVSVNVDYPTAVKGVSYANAATVRRVVVTGGPMITGSVTVDLDDDDTANMNTVALLDTYISSGGIGSVTLLDSGHGVTFASCQMVGDPPSWDGSENSFPINFEAESVLLTTDAS